MVGRKRQAPYTKITSEKECQGNQPRGAYPLVFSEEGRPVLSVRNVVNELDDGLGQSMRGGCYFL